MSFLIFSTLLNTSPHLEFNYYGFIISPTKKLSYPFYKLSTMYPIILPKNPVNARPHSHTISRVPSCKNLFLFLLLTCNKVGPSTLHYNYFSKTQSFLLYSPSSSPPLI